MTFKSCFEEIVLRSRVTWCTRCAAYHPDVSEDGHDLRNVPCMAREQHKRLVLFFSARGLAYTFGVTNYGGILYPPHVLLDGV